MKTNTFHLHSSVVLLTNPRVTNREGWRWDTDDNDNNRGATERRTNEMGLFYHQAKNVDLRAPAPAPPRRRRDARALARCTAARLFSLTVQSAGSSSSSSSCTEAEAAGMGPLVVSALSCR